MKFQIVESMSPAKIDKTIAFINQNCQPFLQMVNAPIYRGIAHSSGDVVVKRVRKHRIPSDMRIELQELFDVAFNKIFGWKPRSQGLFATGDVWEVSQYGMAYAIFPIGEIEFIYSKNIKDLVSADQDRLYTLKGNHKLKDEWDAIQRKRLETYGDTYQENCEKFLRKYPQVLEQFVLKNYTSKNFKGAIQSESEIMIKCDKYIAVKYKHDNGYQSDEGDITNYQKIIKSTIGAK